MRCVQVKIVNRKFVREGGIALSTFSKVETVHEINLEPDLRLFSVFYDEETAYESYMNPEPKWGQ